MRLGPGGRHDEALLLRISQGGIRRVTGIGDLHDPRVSKPQSRGPVTLFVDASIDNLAGQAREIWTRQPREHFEE